VSPSFRPSFEHSDDGLCSDCGDTFADHQLSPEDEKGDRYCEDCREIAAAQCPKARLRSQLDGEEKKA